VVSLLTAGDHSSRQVPLVDWSGRNVRHANTGGDPAMHKKNELDRLATEILRLESETFEVSDYAEINDLFLASCSTCSSTTSTTSCSA
jgi:hypothetical protein